MCQYSTSSEWSIRQIHVTRSGIKAWQMNHLIFFIYLFILETKKNEVNGLQNEVAKTERKKVREKERETNQREKQTATLQRG